MDSILIIPKEAFSVDELIANIKRGIVQPNAISWTAANGFANLTRSLIRLGADVKENSNYPLEMACKNGHTETVRRLLEGGARTSDSIKDEGYCLRMAAYNGYDEIVRMLIVAGANPMADNYCALKFALEQCNGATVEILLEAIFEKRNKLNKFD